jgi:hypothetical protein
LDFYCRRCRRHRRISQIVLFIPATNKYFPSIRPKDIVFVFVFDIIMLMIMIAKQSERDEFPESFILMNDMPLHNFYHPLLCHITPPHTQ